MDPHHPVHPSTSAGSRLDSFVDRYAMRTRGMAASEIRALFAVASRPEVVSLAGGMPALTSLPMDTVGDLLGNLVAKDGQRALQYGSGQGDEVLREQIAALMREVDVLAHPDDVVVTVGSQQALDLITRIFIDPGDVILAEAPSYVGALGAFRSYQANIVHVEMDDDGMVPAALQEAIAAVQAAGKQPKFLYTVPNFHNPAGVSLAEERRAQVLEICADADLLILEDDPYALLGFDAGPSRALRADSPEGVIYLGSFSKTFAPGLRVGWALAPHAVREKLVLAAEASVLCPPSFSQMAVSTYLSEYDWQAQLKTYREVYRERRDAMLHALDDVFPKGAHWTVPGGGFYVWLTLPEGLDSAAMLPRAVTERVAYVPGTAFYADGLGSRSMRLSYCYPSPERIIEGIRRLSSVVEEELQLLQTFGPESIPGPHGVPAIPRPDLA